MSTIIIVEDVDFSYDKYASSSQILKDIKLRVEEGDFIAILGQNGSGKSTLAKLFNAILLPSKGNVFINGINTKLGDITLIRQLVGMVMQDPDSQIVGVTVEEDVAFGPENLGLLSNEIREKVDKALRDVGMIDFINYNTNCLSQGQKQKVVIAGVLAMNPQCIVLDEPTAMLDPVSRRDFIQIIKELNSKGVTIILITHIIEEAVEANKVVVLENGRIIMRGEPREVFSRVDDIKELKLAVPVPTELALRLKNRGIEVRSDILTLNELEDEIIRVFKGDNL